MLEECSNLNFNVWRFRCNKTLHFVNVYRPAAQKYCGFCFLHNQAIQSILKLFNIHFYSQEYTLYMYIICLYMGSVMKKNAKNIIHIWSEQKTFSLLWMFSSFSDISFLSNLAISEMPYILYGNLFAFFLDSWICPFLNMT